MLIKMFSWLLILISSFLPYFKTPLSMASAIFVQCFTISLLVRFIVPCSWIPLTIFMVTIGGLLIIFMYTTSICSNMSFQPIKFKKLFIPLLMFSPITWLLPYVENKNDLISGFDFFSYQYFKLFISLNYFSTLFVFSYLIFVLIILISLLSLFKGPMRKKY